MSAKLSAEDLRVLEVAAAANSHEKNLLARLAKNSIIVNNIQILKKTVRLNSIVLLWHSLLGKVVKLRIVLPKLADLGERNISVFAPISLAILGRSENETVKVDIGGIRKELKIIKVKNSAL